MVHWFSWLQYVGRRHGPLGIVVLSMVNIAYHLRGLGKSTAGTTQADPLDELYGTDTGGIREIGSLDVLNWPAARAAFRYEPSAGQGVRTALDRLGIDYRGYTFIDFGSGKGRVLLVACEFPFKEVIGVEFSRELHEIASHNIARLPPQAVRAGAVQSVHGDAGAFEPPQSNLVCYLYNPFGPPVISEVARRLAAHHERHGCHVIIVYGDPRHREAFEQTGKFAILSETPAVLTLTTPFPPGATTAGCA